MKKTTQQKQRLLRSGRRAVTALTLGVVVLVVPGLYANVTATVRPNPVVVGEPANYVITSTEGRVEPVPDGLPRIAGLDWLSGPSMGQSIQIINFRQNRTWTLSYAFRVTRAGVWRIPPVRIRVKGRVRTAPEVRFKAVGSAAAGSMSIEDLVFVKVTAGNGPGPVPKKVYVGQTFPVRIKVYVLERMWAGMSYPEIEVENAALQDFSRENPDNMRFRRPRQSIEQEDNLPFRVVTFECAMTPLSARPVTGKGTVTVRLRFPQRRRRAPGFPGPFDDFDSFFDDFFGNRRVVEKTVAFLLPKIPVVPLPPKPKDAGEFLGILGNWTLRADLDVAEAAVGDTVALELVIEGTGSLDTLRTPKLDLPGFRVHPPEVKKDQEPGGKKRARITWPIVPLEAGATLPPLKFCTFSPAEGRYRTREFHLNLRVRPAEAGSEGPAVVAENRRPKAGRRPAPEKAKQEATDILYIKTRLGRYVPLPLWRNVIPAGFFPPALGLLLWGGCTLVARRRERLSADEGARRRHEAAKRRAAVIRELRSCPPDRRSAVVCESLAPWLADMLGLPPGATPTEIADALEPRDPELAAMLRRAEEQAFMPGGGTGIDVDALLRRLKRLGLALMTTGLLLFLPLPGRVEAASAGSNAPGVASKETSPGSVPHQAATSSARAEAGGRTAAPASPGAGNDGRTGTFADAVEAYEHGDIPKALAIFQSLNRPGMVNASLEYNCGNCYYRLGKYGDAVAAYERARRAAPRDDAILENLNFVRDRLGLPPVLAVRTPRDLLIRIRDYFRPDEWLWIGVLAVSLCSAWAGVRRLRNKPLETLVYTCAGIVLVCALCAWSQWHGPWKHDRHAVVVSIRAVPHLAPGENADKAGFNLRVGEVIRVEEHRTRWLRVRKGEAEGWVRADLLEIVW